MQRRELTQEETDKLRAITADATRVSQEIIVQGLLEGKSPEEVVERVGKKQRGGAQPGAGRPPGKWAFAKGRRADSALCFRVSSDFRNEFEKKAQEAGLTKTAFLQALVKKWGRQN